MANRFNGWFLNYRGRRWNVYLDDADFVGTSVAFETGADGFTIDYQSDNNTRLSPIVGSSASFGMALLDGAANHADLLTLITDLAGAEEGRFTMKITRGTPALDEVLHWCGYVLPDISRLEDTGTAQEFRVSATDGLARLKGIEYKDESGAIDVPYGVSTVLEHLIRCLTADSVLSGLYFATDDIFLRTVVEWEETGHSTLASNECPTAYTRFSGYVFAELKNNTDWKFKTCYDALSEIAKHWNARLMFSDGCYRFEQLGARSAATFTERRWKKGGALNSSGAGLVYDETINQTLSAGFRLSGGEYRWLPALRTVRITYDHQTYKNYLSGTNYKWYKTSGNSDPLVISNVGFDADSYLRVSGVLTLKVTGPTTYPWRQVFAMYLKVGDYTLKRHSAAVQPFYLIEYDTPAEWLISSVRADISTDFIFSGEFEGQIPFSIWTPVVPSGVNSISVDFDVYGAFDAQENNETTTIADWAFKDLVLTIYNLDTAGNFEAKRIYQANNTDTGNSATVEQEHVFGHTVQKWTQGKLQVSSDLVTWADTTATWKVAGGATNYEFGQLAAAEILAGQSEPLQTYSGQVQAAEAFAHYRIITSGDSLQWLLMRGSFDGQFENLSGEWWNCGVDRTKSDIDTPFGLPFDPAVNPNVPSGMAGQISPGINMPAANGTNIALNALTNNFTDAALTAGAVTTIPVVYPLKEDAYELNDEIILVNPQSGKIAQLTVTTNSNSGDLALAVSGTIPEDFPVGSYLIYSSLNKTTNQGGISSPANYWTKTGSVIQNNNIGQVRIANTFRIGSVTGITPTTLIGRDGTNGDVGTVTVGSGLSLAAGTLSTTTSGTVTSVALDMPAAVFDVAGSPITGSGTFTVTLDNQTANTVFAGPSTGSPAAPTFRALVAGDIPAVSGSAITGLTDNQVLFGSATGGIEQSANLTYDGTSLSALTSANSATSNIIIRNSSSGSGAVGMLRMWNDASTASNRGFVAQLASSAYSSPYTSSLVWWLYENANQIWATNNGARMLLNATGLFLGAATTPSERLHVSGNAYVTGNIGAGVQPATARLHVSGNAYVTGNIGAGVQPATARLHAVGTDNTTIIAQSSSTVGTTFQVKNTSSGGGDFTFSTAGSANAYPAGSFLGYDVNAAKTRYWVDPTGNFGITDGTSLAARLHVKGSGNTSGSVTAILENSAGTDILYVRDDGLVSIGNSSPAQTLHVTGTMRLTASDGTATTIMGRDADGDVSAITVGSGLSLAGNTLTATGGTISGLTPTRIPFASSATALDDDANLTWDDTNKRLVVGTGTSAGFINVFSGALGVATEMIRMSGNISSNMIMSLLNANNATTNANSLFQISTGGASAGDPVIQFTVSGAVTHAFGVDNSDADKIKITPGQSLPGGAANRGLIITNAATALVGINNDGPVHPLDIVGRARATLFCYVQDNPSVTFGAGAGTGPSGSCTGGSNGFQISFTTGTTPTNNALVFTVTLGTGFPSVHQFTWSPRNAQAATDYNKFYVSGFSATQISVTANGTLAASTQYVFYFVGIGY